MQKKYTIIGKPSCGWIPVKMNDGSGFTYLSTLGDLMPFRFAEVTAFKDGMAVVVLQNAEGERKYTFLSQDEILCPIAFEDISYFDGSYGKGWIGNEEYYVDRKFTVFQLKNTLLDKIEIAKGPVGQMNVVMKSGLVKKYDFIFRICGPRADGMLPINMKDGSGYTFIDENYNIMPHRFLTPSRFKKGFADVITKTGSFGKVDKKGNITLIGEDEVTQEMKNKRSEAIRKEEFVEEMLEIVERLKDSTTSEFLKKFLSDGAFCDRCLKDYLKVRSDEERQAFKKKYNATDEDIDIMENGFSAYMGGILKKMEELDDEDEGLNNN